MLRIHHINCGTLSPLGGRLIDGFSHGLNAKLVCHCWIVETNDGLVLVDTGPGGLDALQGTSWPIRYLSGLKATEFLSQNTARAQVEKLGYKASDVRDIVLTHLDFDHSGGLSDFPEATVHIMAAELSAARAGRTWLDRQRYRSLREASVRWITYDMDAAAAGDAWFGFNCVRSLRGLPPEILLVPMSGHSAGHAGVAVLSEHGWMLHAGDAYFYRREMEADRRHCTLGLRLAQRLTEVNHDARMVNLERLRDLVRFHSTEVRVCSAHDAIEFAAYQASAEPLRLLQRFALPVAEG